MVTKKTRKEKQKMQFYVFSRGKAQRMSYSLSAPTIIISITDSGKEPVHFAKNPNIKDICRVTFDDTEPDILLSREVLMTRDDAEKIKRFVVRYKDEVENIIVHCEAGVSRSAAIMAAIQLYLTGSADDIFSNPKYCPNPFCFEMMKAVFSGGEVPSVTSYQRKDVNATINQKKKLTIIINGKGGVGKDALCDSLAGRYRVRNRSSITPIKEIARQHGWNGEKDLRSRRFLAELKRVFSEYNDLPTEYLLDEYAKFMQSNDQVLFVHIREADQIARFVLAVGGNCKTLLVRRDVAEAKDGYGNRADDNVEDYPYDVTFDNNKPFEESSSDFAALIESLMAD